MIEVKPTPSDRFIRIRVNEDFEVMLGSNKARAFLVALKACKDMAGCYKVAGTSVTVSSVYNFAETLTCGRGSVTISTAEVDDLTRQVLRWLHMSQSALDAMADREIAKLVKP